MKTTTRRPYLVGAICAAIMLLFAVSYQQGLVPLQRLEFFARDLETQTRFSRRTPIDPRLVLIGVDKPVYASDFSDEELQQEPVLRHLQKNFPWSRAVWARLIERLADAGAKVIILDFIFAAPGDGDDELRAVLEKYKDRVVIGYNINETKTDRGILKQLLLPNESVLAPPASGSILEDDRLGYVSVWTDWDGTLRRARYRLTGAQAGDVAPPEVVLASLAARALKKFGRADLIPPGFDWRLFRYTAPPTLGYLPQPIGDVLSPKLWSSNYTNGLFFRNKIVLIGPTAEIFHDAHPTPFVNPQREMPGPEIHLNLINAALHGEFLHEPSMTARLGVIALAGVLAAALCFLVSQPFKRLAVALVLTIGYGCVALYLFNRSGLSARIALVATPALVLILSNIAVLAYDYLLERFEKRRVRKTLERYVSRDVVKELLDNPETYFNSVGGVRRPVAILFSDVRNFTTMTESADSAALVKQLNEYLTEMVKLVFVHQGSLDKFIGDAVMAVWGNIVSHGPGQDAKNAVATALAMKKRLAQLNEDWEARGIKPFAFGIGLNYGEVIVGEMGSSEKVEFTAIGDAVNVASRLEGYTKEYHLDLLLGENVAKLVNDIYILRLVDCIQAKGKTKPLDIYTVMGEGAGQTVSLPLWLARYEEGVRLYRSRKFAEAAGLFQESLRRQPEDFLSDMYLRRCQALIADPPDDSWNGVFVMTKK